MLRSIPKTRGGKKTTSGPPLSVSIRATRRRRPRSRGLESCRFSAGSVERCSDCATNNARVAQFHVDKKIIFFFIIIICYYCYPTGTTATRVRRVTLTEVASSHFSRRRGGGTYTGKKRARRSNGDLEGVRGGQNRARVCALQTLP